MGRLGLGLCPPARRTDGDGGTGGGRARTRVRRRGRAAPAAARAPANTRRSRCPGQELHLLVLPELPSPHLLHRRSGRVSVQAVMPDAGVPHALRDRSLDASSAPCSSGRRPSPSRTWRCAINSLVLQRSVARPRLSRWDRILWVWLSRVWAGWRPSLVIVQPATVLAWHRRGFRLYWRWRSRANPVGRPRLDPELRHLIRRMARENPTWGRRRIQAELALLGYDVAELTVAKYMHRTSPRPSPTWRAFLATHAREIVAVDFFLVPTLTFRLLFVFVVLRHDRRELLHVNVTDHPTAAGPRANSSRPSRRRPRRSTCSEIETRSTARSSPGASTRWESGR